MDQGDGADGHCNLLFSNVALNFSIVGLKIFAQGAELHEWEVDAVVRDFKVIKDVRVLG